MPTDMIRQQTPEEVELVRKRKELAVVRAELVERELELADLRARLKSFEGRYLREVGLLYSELDEWEARIAELEASLEANSVSEQRAKEYRERADESHQATHGEAAKALDFQPSADLRTLFRDVAKYIHPDFAKDDADRLRRHDLMARANEAYSRGDSESLQRILKEYRESSEAVHGEGIGNELIRIIRQIHQARMNIETIKEAIAKLYSGELARLMRDAENAGETGRDLLAELAASISGKISAKKKAHRVVAMRVSNNG